MISAAADMTGWWIGWVTAAAIVLVVAVLVLYIIWTARRIADTAEQATGTLETIETRTRALWKVHDTISVTVGIAKNAGEIRRGLGGRVGDEAVHRGQHVAKEDLKGDLTDLTGGLDEALKPNPAHPADEGSS